MYDLYSIEHIAFMSWQGKASEKKKKVSVMGWNIPKWMDNDYTSQSTKLNIAFA